MSSLVWVWGWFCVHYILIDFPLPWELGSSCAGSPLLEITVHGLLVEVCFTYLLIRWILYYNLTAISEKS